MQQVESKPSTYRDFANGHLTRTDIPKSKKFEMVLNITLGDTEVSKETVIKACQALCQQYFDGKDDLPLRSNGYYESNI